MKQKQSLIQTQSQTQSQKQSQKLAHIGAQDSKPLFLINEDSSAITDSPEQAEDLNSEPDTYYDFDDFSGDEESYSIEDEYELQNEYESSIGLRHFPIGEINLFHDKIFYSIKNPQGGELTKTLKTAIKLIIQKNREFIYNNISTPSSIPQKEIETERNKSSISRFLKNNYITFPNGYMYQLSYFFSNIPGVKAKDSDNLEEFIREMIQNENKKIMNLLGEGKQISIRDLFSDEFLAEGYSANFEKKGRKTIERARKKIGIKSINERLSDYSAIS